MRQLSLKVKSCSDLTSSLLSSASARGITLSSSPVQARLSFNWRNMASTSGSTSSTTNPLIAILGDRKKMEQERLARLAKKRGAPTESEVINLTSVKQHKSSSSSSTTTTTAKGSGSLKKRILDPLVSNQATSAVEADPASVVQEDATPSTTNKLTSAIRADENLGSTSSSKPPTLQYPHGTIKQTWAFGYPRKNDIKIEEVLRKADLKIALLSSWQIEMDWVMSKIDLNRTKLILAYGERDEEAKQRHRDGAEDWGNSLRLCFPPMGRGIYDCMHSKLMLLFYQDSMRVVVPSANLVRFDWGETGVMQNTIFLVDLPRLPESRQGDDNDTLTSFATELIHFVKAMHVDDDVRDPARTISSALLKFDYSQTKHIAFVHTIGQTYWGLQEAVSTGYPQLAKAVRSIGMQTKADMPIQVDYTASSIGSLTSDRVELMCRALRGLYVEMPTSATKKSAETPDPVPLHQRFRIYYPSDDTVQQSRGGPQNGGTLFMAESWSKSTFPTALLRDGISRRTGLLSHSKMALVRTPAGAFVYTGSANLSQNAWGTVTWDRTRKAPKLNCPNWECGVLMRARRADEVLQDEVETESDTGEDAAVELDDDGVVPMSAFSGLLDVPFVVPSRAYGDGVVPWIQPQRRR